MTDPTVPALRAAIAHNFTNPPNHRFSPTTDTALLRTMRMTRTTRTAIATHGARVATPSDLANEHTPAALRARAVQLCAAANRLTS